MKYLLLITDGAAGWPLPDQEVRPALNLLARPTWMRWRARVWPGWFAPFPRAWSPAARAPACLAWVRSASVLQRRGSIEARSMELPVGPERLCSAVIWSASGMAGWTATVAATSAMKKRTSWSPLNDALGDEEVSFHPGIRYRHICKIRGHEETLCARCTPAHRYPAELSRSICRG
jgi:2,3-bisphosphoglycerate-independent phosphoglycerate mutase